VSNKPRILITGSAGFIGANLLWTLKNSGFEVLGVDNYSPYYSPSMKFARGLDLGLSEITKKIDIENYRDLQEIFETFKPTVVINLAAQGGVRASRIDPLPYIGSNQLGFLNLLNLSKELKVHKFIYASSSSVYGDSNQIPFREDLKLSAPKSLYALSKLSNEIVAENFNSPEMKRIGLRFFTVYGPWGRPDMAMFRILASIRLKKDFKLTASPAVTRDFTYVDDVCSIILRLIQGATIKSQHEIFNVAGGKPYSLRQLFDLLQEKGMRLKITQADHDKLDVRLTHGAVDKLASFNLPIPSSSLNDGLNRTIEWVNTIDVEHLETWFDYSANA
jgi:UDP-glucuronate 4-epimerase